MTWACLTPTAGLPPPNDTPNKLKPVLYCAATEGAITMGCRVSNTSCFHNWAGTFSSVDHATPLTQHRRTRTKGRAGLELIFKELSKPSPEAVVPRLPSPAYAQWAQPLHRNQAT